MTPAERAELNRRYAAEVLGWDSATPGHRWFSDDFCEDGLAFLELLSQWSSRSWVLTQQQFEAGPPTCSCKLREHKTGRPLAEEFGETVGEAIVRALLAAKKGGEG